LHQESANQIKQYKLQKKQSTDSGIRFAKIQDIEVGERAIGTNPELTDSERSAFLPDPEPTAWRKFTLEMIKERYIVLVVPMEKHTLTELLE
jgi:hypothetical protein